MHADDLIQPRPVSMALVVIVSLFLPGMGHVYLGQRTKGIIIFVGSILTCGVLGLACIFAALDATHLARKLQRDEPIGPWEGWGLLDRVANFF